MLIKKNYGMWASTQVWGGPKFFAELFAETLRYKKIFKYKFSLSTFILNLKQGLLKGQISYQCVHNYFDN